MAKAQAPKRQPKKRTAASSKKKTGAKATPARKQSSKATVILTDAAKSNIPPRSGPLPTLVLDTGGWTIKHGIVYPEKIVAKEDDGPQQSTPKLSPNISAKPAHQVTTLLSDQIHTIHNKAQLRLTWPMERGYTSDLGTQVQLWGYILEKEGLNCMHSFSTGGVTSIYPSLATSALSGKKKGAPSSSSLQQGKDKTSISTMTHTHAIMVLSQPFTPRCILEKEDEIFFRTFGFGKVIRRLGQCCSAFRYLHALEKSKEESVGDRLETSTASSSNTSELRTEGKIIDDETRCCCVVDSGFSLTHVVPTFNACALQSGIKRINIGGKVLTSILKEEIGYRQYNLKDQFFVVNEAKEALCFVSKDFQGDIRSARRIRPGLRPFDRNFVLPDFVQTFHGTVMMPSSLNHDISNDEKDQTNDEHPKENKEDDVIEGYDSEEESEEQIRQRLLKQREEERRQKEIEEEQNQILSLSVERFTTPEVLFRPSDIGLDQVGIAEAIVQSIESCDPIYQAAMYHNIVLTGGNVSIPNFKERLEEELRSLAPLDCKIRIHLPKDPISYAWNGAKDMLKHRDYLSKESLDRVDYEVAKNAKKSAGELWGSLDSDGRADGSVVI